jgi:glycosyltransferase involved in cell wall biosynthesis
MFGRWAANGIRKGSFDVAHCFSGVATELFTGGPFSNEAAGNARPARLVVRGSCHIATQDDILREEELRSNQSLERPCQSIIDREQLEYRHADLIMTLSTFAYESFVNRGIPKERLALLPLGVNTSDFRASEGVLQARLQRIAAGDPLRVLWVGTMSLQKGLLDYVEIVRALAGENFRFRSVGDIPAGMDQFIAGIRQDVEFVPRQRQWELRKQYDWADLFVFPTLQDGFAVVLAQAAANGLPLLATTNCAGPDIISEGSTGWVLPIRSPQSFVDRLRWCDRNRTDLAAMVTRMNEKFAPRSWDDVASDFERICERMVGTIRNAAAPGQTARIEQ